MLAFLFVYFISKLMGNPNLINMSVKTGQTRAHSVL